MVTLSEAEPLMALAAAPFQPEQEALESVDSGWPRSAVGCPDAVSAAVYATLIVTFGVGRAWTAEYGADAEDHDRSSSTNWSTSSANRARRHRDVYYPLNPEDVREAGHRVKEGDTVRSSMDAFTE
jgi:hypothetical protein